MHTFFAGPFSFLACWVVIVGCFVGVACGMVPCFRFFVCLLVRCLFVGCCIMILVG
ncbi:hypothetical protein F4861DRAFT_525773 [Xylaria intraflava]|nr:hypothetical protein F4861DRAFT_525773 [Xylaria intraflava]